MPQRRLDFSGLSGLALAIGAVLVAQRLEGGQLSSLMQPTAAMVVFGGTLAALMVSFPLATLKRTVHGVRAAFTAAPPSMRSLVAEIADLALRSKKKGLMSLENAALESRDRFLGRALGLAIDGLPPEAVRRTMETESHAQEEFDDEVAHVLESAAGYAPTLGILGAVLGLIHVMENIASPSRLGGGIAVAFVATVYGVASANLLLMPLAARVRHQTRMAALRRELIIEGIVSMQQGLHPRQLEEQLEAYIRLREQVPAARRAA
jgi:chemotaxis protein MotA